MKFLTAISIIVSIASTCNKNITVQLDGSKSFSDNGSIVSWNWYEVSGPAKIIFDNANNPVVNISGNSPVAGQYIIGLDVTDAQGNKGSGTATINVTK